MLRRVTAMAEQQGLGRTPSAGEEDRTFFKKSLAFFGGSVGLGGLVVCCALVAPLFVSAVAATVLGFLSGAGGVVVAVVTGGVFTARAIRRRRTAASVIEPSFVPGTKAGAVDHVIDVHARHASSTGAAIKLPAETLTADGDRLSCCAAWRESEEESCR